MEKAALYTIAMILVEKLRIARCRSNILHLTGAPNLDEHCDTKMEVLDRILRTMPEVQEARIEATTVPAEWLAAIREMEAVLNDKLTKAQAMQMEIMHPGFGSREYHVDELEFL